MKIKNMTPATIVTESMIAEAERRGACDEALEWLYETPRPLAEVCAMHPRWLIAHAADRLPTELLAQCALLAPRTAMRLVAHALPAGTLAACARLEPQEALRQAAYLMLPPSLLAELQALVK